MKKGVVFGSSAWIAVWQDSLPFKPFQPLTEVFFSNFIHVNAA